MGSQGEEPVSLETVECIKRSDMYPKVGIVYDDPTVLQIPFPLLCGENALFLGRCADGLVTLTNFRFHICMRKSFFNIPLRLIESVESRDMFYLVMLCKDGTSVRCKFSNNESCQLWLKRILECTGPPKDLTKLFAFAFYSYGSEVQESHSQASALASYSSNDQGAKLCVQLEHKYFYSFGKDVERMQFDTCKRKVWRIFLGNEDYSLCRTYPKYHIVPENVSDEMIKSAASFRSGGRFPSVVWRDQRNGAVIARCSQPELGWLGWRNNDDEALAKAIPEACARNLGNHNCAAQEELIQETCAEGERACKVKAYAAQKMLVVDCRSYSAAIANRAKGGGCESPDYYTNCEVRFMNMANIHSIRKSYQALRLLCSSFPDQSWLTNLDATKWLQHLGAILYGTLVVVGAVEDARPVLIHCSDGWDRTAQISSTAQLLLDPFYRTIQGFQWLVEREWLQFGHKFADRCGHAVGSQDPNELSPVFVQWLDCVYQVMRQFPCHFQFNEAFLVKLVQHTYSCLFGTFLFNTSREREKEWQTNPTSSVWTLLHADNAKFYNPLYNPFAKEVLKPEWSMHRLTLWNSVYLSNNSLKTSSADEFAASVEQADQVLTPDDEPGTLTKTRSCENLTSVTSATQEAATSMIRRSSDPNIGCGGDTLALLSKEVDSSRALGDASPSDSSSSSITDRSEEGKMRGDGVVKFNETTAEEEEESAALAAEAEKPKEREVACGPDGCEKVILVQPSATLAPPPLSGPSLTEPLVRPDVLPASPAVEEHSTPSQTDIPAFDRSQSVESEANDRVPSGHKDSCLHILVNGHSKLNNESTILMNGHGHVCAKQKDDINEEVKTKSSYGIYEDPEHFPQLALHNNNSLIDNKAFESSTDTLTGSEEVVDQAQLLKSRRRFYSEVTNPSAAAMHHNGMNGHCDSDSDDGRLVKKGERRDLDAASVKSLKLMIQRNCSISTSTTDISDSHVSARSSRSAVHGNNGVASEMVARTAGLGLFIRCNSGLCGQGYVGRPTPSSSEASPSVCSLAATPINSHTPPSTCSPTPGSEGKNYESPLVRQLNSVARHLDCDGLTTFVDGGIERVQLMMTEYQRRIAELEARLAAANAHLNQVMPSYNGAGHGPDPMELLCQELSDGGELSSLGTESNPASDVSWEQVDERESRVTLWVPDHVVKNCAACSEDFWIGRRKHHCRNCGKVYCGSCSNFFAPVPTQHLTEPVRLCSSCYNHLHRPGHGAASDDSRIAVGAD